MKDIIYNAKITAFILGGSLLWASVFAVPSYILEQERMQQHGE